MQAVSLEMITMPVTPMDSSPLAASPAALTPNLTPRKLSKLGHVEPVERGTGLIPAWAPGAASPSGMAVWSWGAMALQAGKVPPNLWGEQSTLTGSESAFGLSP